MKVIESKFPKEVNMYHLTLHKSMRAHSEDTEIEIIRVPGGWIYRFFQWIPSENKWINATSVYIPYNNEFDDYRLEGKND
ncbi:MAG: hypothetical protein ACFE9S_07460 [Candidatus Hermodarchaeota archaeon]